MLGLCKEGHIGTVMEHITCHSHNGSLRSLRILQDDIHHILHNHSRAQPQPHACRSSPCCSQDRNHHILHGSLRSHRIRSRAQPRPLACHNIPCILQDCIHHILC